MQSGQGDLGRFPPLMRVQIEQLACCDPEGVGLHMTHWSARSLALAAIDQGLVPRIAYSTVSMILRDADLQPHRSRYWKTPTLDEKFRRRAARVLWCYENVERLAERGELVICLDEKANMQALERAAPTQPMMPGQIQRIEHEYIRHGVVNFLVALFVQTGKMRGWCLDSNDSPSLGSALYQLFGACRGWKKVHLIWDGGPSHTSNETAALLRQYAPYVRVLLTPAHASWLNQAELLLRMFGERYLKRGNWESRVDLKRHLMASWPEYNRLYATPIDWSWTRRNLKHWLARHDCHD